MGNKLHTFLILLLYGICMSPAQLAGQNKYTVKIVQPDPVQAPVISSVTVSPENKNRIEWEQTANENIKYFKIYREAANPEDGWANVGKKMYPGDFTFIDPSSYPNVRSYRYRISTVDQCDNEIFNIINHKTIKLTVDEITSSVNLLKWNPYVGFEIGGYKIYRGPDVINLTPIDTTLTESYNDNENPYKNVFYQVEAIGKEVIPAEKKLSLVSGRTRSNIASNKSILSSTDTTDADKIHVYPNPLRLNAIIIFPYDADQTQQLSILDLTGKTVYSTLVTTGEVEIERQDLKEGIYIIQIKGKNVYRKKLMVGRI